MRFVFSKRSALAIAAAQILLASTIIATIASTARAAGAGGICGFQLFRGGACELYRGEVCAALCTEQDYEARCAVDLCEGGVLGSDWDDCDWMSLDQCAYYTKGDCLFLCEGLGALFCDERYVFPDDLATCTTVLCSIGYNMPAEICEST